MPGRRGAGRTSAAGAGSLSCVTTGVGTPRRPPAWHTGSVGLFDRFRRGARRRGAGSGGSGSSGQAGAGADEEYLTGWVGVRRGVEGFVEPQTAMSKVTLLLVAHDGEWTRRQVPSVDWAHWFCNQHRVPSYDAAVVGVPQRMRDYNRRVSLERKRADRTRGTRAPEDRGPGRAEPGDGAQ